MDYEDFNTTYHPVYVKPKLVAEGMLNYGEWRRLHGCDLEFRPSKAEHTGKVYLQVRGVSTNGAIVVE
jgi:hypothetical protein